MTWHHSHPCLNQIVFGSLNIIAKEETAFWLLKWYEIKSSTCRCTTAVWQKFRNSTGQTGISQTLFNNFLLFYDLKNLNKKKRRENRWSTDRTVAWYLELTRIVKMSILKTRTQVHRSPRLHVRIFKNLFYFIFRSLTGNLGIYFFFFKKKTLFIVNNKTCVTGDSDEWFILLIRVIFERVKKKRKRFWFKTRR